RAAKAASSCQGRYLLPHALNSHATAATSPSADVTKVGPKSRAHESSNGTSKMSTFPPVASFASAASRERTAIVTGSNEEIARATRAKACFALSSASGLPNASVLHGQHIQVRACGTHSGGIE